MRANREIPQNCTRLTTAIFRVTHLPALYTSSPVKEAWIDASKCDERAEQVGGVGYEIPFNRYFYQYEPPRGLAEIDVDQDLLSAEIMEMLREVHS